MLSSEQAVYTLDPLADRRWPEFLARHAEASVFHTPEWLQALQDTYGYKPIVFTTSNGADLANGIVFCQVQSWLTGNRLVSLPFSDHCQPLAADDDLQAILRFLQDHRRAKHLKYVELRPLSDSGIVQSRCVFGLEEAFGFHTIDLHPELVTIYRGFHDSCVRRKIKKAEREKLSLESGHSTDLLNKFRHLLLLTRRRHKLPPQPAEWFSNLAHCLGDKLTIHLVSKDGVPAASILTLKYKNKLMYKYGCSDAKFHNLGGMPLLFWKAIQDGKRAGMEQFDLGRSGSDDPGLAGFKGHLGAVASEIRYYRDPPPREKKEAAQIGVRWVREAMACLPEPVLVGAGNLFYRHLG